MTTSSSKEICLQGWLWKSPPAKSIFRPRRWSRQWFVLKCGAFPQQYVLEYFHEEGARRPKRTINLDECEQICGPLNVQDRQHQYAFHLQTPKRTFYLAANSESEMHLWIKALSQVCGFRMVEEDANRDAAGVVYAKPTNKRHPALTSSRQLSKGPSGAYIPISECITGKTLQYKPTRDPANPTISDDFGLYCNLAEKGGSGTSGGTLKPQQSPSSNQPSSSEIAPGANATSPPKVDRNLKPQLKNASETSLPSTLPANTPSDGISSQNSSRDEFPGPEIDRSRKPPDGPNASASSSFSEYQGLYGAMQSCTIVSSRKIVRQQRPTVSPGGKIPVDFIDSEAAEELTGVYTEVDCNPSRESDAVSQMAGIKPTTTAADTVEYHDIDLARTSALKQLRQYRDRQLQTNSKRHFT